MHPNPKPAVLGGRFTIKFVGIKQARLFIRMFVRSIFMGNFFFAICQSLIYNSPRKITYGKRSFDRKRLSRETVSGGCVHTEILCLLRKTGVQRIWNLQFVLELKRVTLCCFNPLPLTRQRDSLIERANKCSLHVARLANCECINSCRWHSINLSYV